MGGFNLQVADIDKSFILYSLSSSPLKTNGIQLI